MRKTRVASRYAKSLLDLAVERKETDRAFSDMKYVADACSQCKELSQLLRSPIVKTDKKLEILQSVFGDHLGESSLFFIQIIAKKRRESHLEGIAESFLTQYKAYKNIVSAVVTTSMKLDTKVKNKIMALVKETSNSKVELVERIDNGIIGGFVLRIGDKQLDETIQRKLSDLRTEFGKNPYIADL